jgi:hypothetical protein
MKVGNYERRGATPSKRLLSIDIHRQIISASMDSWTELRAAYGVAGPGYWVMQTLRSAERVHRRVSCSATMEESTAAMEVSAHPISLKVFVCGTL